MILKNPVQVVGVVARLSVSNLLAQKPKKRRLQQLLQSHSTSELSYATRLSLRSSGKRHAAEIVKAATDTTPTRAAKIRKAYKTSLEKTTSVFTPEEALAMLIDLKLTKNQYILLRKRSRDKGIDMYPSYEAIKKAKEECYPQKESITITESSAEVRLQDLLDCTVQRIATVQKEVLKQCAGDLSLSSIECIYKWLVQVKANVSNGLQKLVLNL